MIDLATLSRVRLFEALSAQELATLHGMMHLKTFVPDAVILEKGRSGDGVYILLDGTTKVFIRRKDGHEVILNILGAGQVLGEIDAVDQDGHSASVVTLETCRFLWMEEADFARCRQMMPALDHNLVSILAQRMRRLTNQLEAVAALDTGGRVACQLLAFAQNYGQVSPHGDILLPLHLTQSDLAGLIGASREHVNRVLAHYKRQGHISVGPGSRYTIHDRQALALRCQGFSSHKDPDHKDSDVRRSAPK